MLGADNADFAVLVRQHQAMVFSIALHCLQNREAAEDISQDVFLQLYRNLDRIQSEDHCRHWLRRITSQRCIDHSRKHRASKRPLPLENAPEPIDSGGEKDLLLSETLRRLVASLPENPRLIMILRYQEDLDPEEIAGVLNMPVRTVKSHLHRAVGLLREKFQRRLKEVRTS